MVPKRWTQLYEIIIRHIHFSVTRWHNLAIQQNLSLHDGAEQTLSTEGTGFCKSDVASDAMLFKTSWTLRVKGFSFCRRYSGYTSLRTLTRSSASMSSPGRTAIDIRSRSSFSARERPRGIPIRCTSAQRRRSAIIPGTYGNCMRTNKGSPTVRL